MWAIKITKVTPRICKTTVSTSDLHWPSDLACSYSAGLRSSFDSPGLLLAGSHPFQSPLEFAVLSHAQDKKESYNTKAAKEHYIPIIYLCPAPLWERLVVDGASSRFGEVGTGADGAGSDEVGAACVGWPARVINQKKKERLKLHRKFNTKWEWTLFEWQNRNNPWHSLTKNNLPFHYTHAGCNVWRNDREMTDVVSPDILTSVPFTDGSALIAY